MRRKLTLKLTIERTKDGYFVWDKQFLRATQEPTLPEALQVYGEYLIDYFNSLGVYTETLAPHQQRDRKALSNVL